MGELCSLEKPGAYLAMLWVLLHLTIAAGIPCSIREIEVGIDELTSRVKNVCVICRTNRKGLPLTVWVEAMRT